MKKPPKKYYARDVVLTFDGEPIKPAEPTEGKTPDRSCPACNATVEERDKRDPDIRRELRDAGFSGEGVNPGGRMLFFRDGRRLQIGDQCFVCDAKKIRAFLAAETPE